MTALRTAIPGGSFRLPTSFYRGGTSKGLLWSTSTLAPFPTPIRDAIILRSMGSPDPDKRQIDGLGGGISSLSKTAIVGPPDPSLSHHCKDGVEWADDLSLASDAQTGWDLVYRFGQVPVAEGTEVDWTSTCGNLVSAVALYGLHQGHVTQDRIDGVYEERKGRKGQVGDKFSFPTRLLVTCDGRVVRANVPMTLYSQNGGKGVWYPDLEGDTAISGVPGTAPGILIETPLASSLLPTGNQLDTVQVGDRSYGVTIIDAGLPTIFIASSSLSHVLDPSQLPLLSPSELDANIALMTLLDNLRTASASLTPGLQRTLSPSAPKICIVHPKPADGYTTTGGGKVRGEEMDLLIRAVSVGNLHRTVPATCLSALAVGRALPGSTIEQAVQAGGKAKGEDDGIVTIRVGQPAGVSEASVKVRSATSKEEASGLNRVPESIVYYRTARRIIEGWVDVPHSLIS